MGNRYSCKMTFEDWCINNDRQDLLDRWDYDKNEKLPSQVAYRGKQKIYFHSPDEYRRLDRVTTSDDIGKYKNIESHREDLTGQVFGELTVLCLDIEKTKNTDNYHSYWVCRCSCGDIIRPNSNQLKSGHTKTCGNRSIHYIGENNPSWKGGITPESSQIRQSRCYKDYREAVLQKDDYSCIICGSTQNPEVHHIYPFASFPDDRFRVDCGVTLCTFHHNPYYEGSFHNIYSTFHNTPEQLEEYVNMKRQELGINEYFDVYEYMNPYDADDMEIDDSMLDLYE